MFDAYFFCWFRVFRAYAGSECVSCWFVCMRIIACGAGHPRFLQAKITYPVREQSSRTESTLRLLPATISDLLLCKKRRRPCIFSCVHDRACLRLFVNAHIFCFDVELQSSQVLCFMLCFSMLTPYQASFPHIFAMGPIGRKGPLSPPCRRSGDAPPLSPDSSRGPCLR